LECLTELVYGVLPEDLTELVINHSPVLEIDCAHLPKTLEVLDLQNCSDLERVLNLDQLPKLTRLLLGGSSVRTLSRLPASLRVLNVHYCIHLTGLPPLGRTQLERLDIDWATFDTLPQLPETLRILSARWSNLGANLPPLPESLEVLDLDGSVAVRDGFLPQRSDHSFSITYTPMARIFWNACIQKERYDQIHEELMQVAWHRDRVSKWLDHGEDVLDMMMGVSS